MLFVVHCLDKSDALQRRLTHYEAHKVYLETGAVKTVISGPLLAEDNVTAIGSLFVLEADTIRQVEDFNANDPFRRADVWETISIKPFLLRVDHRSQG